MTLLSFHRITLAIFLTFMLYVSCAQEKDSLTIYDKIKTASGKSKFATWLYRAVFVDPKPNEYPVHPASSEEKIVNPYLKYENKIIRQVNIKVYDPFGYSVYDSTLIDKDFFQTLGNHLHITTRRWVIKNWFLFKKNEPLNPLTLSETERLLRQTGYMNDARIFVTETFGADSVDINVLVQDKWTVTMPVVLTDVSANAKYRNQNILGLGHQYEQYIGATRKSITDYAGYYNISGINHTFISSQIYYRTNSDGTNTGIAFDRPFYSPLAKWGGGLGVNRSWKYYRYTDPDNNTEKKMPLNSWGYDMWIGKSFKLNSKRKFFNQSTNIIVEERFLTNTFDLRPSQEIDSVAANLNNSAFIGNIGLSVQQFYKDKYIYRFGINEDVPHGLIVQLLYGADKTEFKNIKYYFGFEIARAKKINLGYFSNTLSYGVFFNKYIPNDVTLNYKLNYFSNLLQAEKWYFRQFINYNLVYCENVLAPRKVTFTPEELYGLDGGTLTGNSKMVINFETVAYAPYSIIGFRFAPVLMAGLGMIGNREHGFIKSNLFQAYSLGVMFRNENLLNSTFQFSFGVYPYSPNGEKYVMKYNPVTSFTLKVRAFSITRPEFLSY